MRKLGGEVMFACKIAHSNVQKNGQARQASRLPSQNDNEETRRSKMMIFRGSLSAMLSS